MPTHHLLPGLWLGDNTLPWCIRQFKALKSCILQVPHPILFNSADWPALKSSTDSPHLVRADVLWAQLLFTSSLWLLSNCICTGSPVFSYLKWTEPGSFKMLDPGNEVSTLTQAQQCPLTDFTLEWLYIYIFKNCLLMCKYGTLDNGRLISAAIIKRRRLIGE